MDGLAQAAEYFKFENQGNSSVLNIINTPPWTPGDNKFHTVVIVARDHVSFNYFF